MNPLRTRCPHAHEDSVSTPDDVEGIAAIYAPIVLETTISFEWDPPRADAFRARIAKTLTKSVVGEPVSLHSRGCTRKGAGKALYTELFRELVDLG